MPQLNTEDRQRITHPELEQASIEIRTNDTGQSFLINTYARPLNVADLEKFAELVNGVLQMELNRLSQPEVTEELA